MESRISNEWRRDQNSRKDPGEDLEYSRACHSGGNDFKCGPSKDGYGAPTVSDLNNSPRSSGFFLFIENDTEFEETFDLGEEYDLEPAIKDEIEKKKETKIKELRNLVIVGQTIVTDRYLITKGEMVTIRDSMRLSKQSGSVNN
ncbi:hypothetical protein L2E82_35547 [Cichorium intybus]|uniref:Uncharacterized protein n=1 Tax=Cichorium intybus TaxID=13427 RepID=A0ACB9BPG1_CICIN|nr:hypothetical protein L2E82_35547 [Cichorium intybus]